MFILHLIKSNIPIFGAVLFGYLSSYFHMLGKRATSVLSDFVFLVALPCMVLNQFSKFSIDKVFNIAYMSTYIVSSTILIVLGWFVAKKFFKQSLGEIALTMMTAGQVNTAFLAIPIFLLFFKTVSPVVMVTVFQQLILAPFILGIIEYASIQSKVEKTGFSSLKFIMELPKVLMRTPIIPASLVGFLMSYFHIGFPSSVSYFLSLMGKGAAPISLFVLGLSLEQDKISFRKGAHQQQVMIRIFLKNFIHPLIAFSLGKYWFDLQPYWLLAVSLMAAMPSSRTCALYAQRYGLDVQTANTLIVLSTFTSFAMINVILYLSGDMTLVVQQGCPS